MSAFLYSAPLAISSIVEELERQPSVVAVDWQTIT
jgi:hypothetical protein